MDRTGVEEQIREIAREIELRKRVYPRWVEDGRYTQVEADHKIAVMEAVLATLKRLRERVEPSLFGDQE